MRSSPTRKYDNFSNDQQGKDTDKNSLDSQDTASVVSNLLKLLIFVCVRDVIDLFMYRCLGLATALIYCSMTWVHGCENVMGTALN